MPSVDPRLMAHAVRFLSMDAIERVGEGHPGTPLGAADIATALFTRHLKFNPQDPLRFDRDRFVESNGHGSMLLYALLHLRWGGRPSSASVCQDAVVRTRSTGAARDEH